MKFPRVFQALSLLRLVRRGVEALEKLAMLYELDLAERGIVVQDPKRAGKDWETEVVYGVKNSNAQVSWNEGDRR